MAAALSVAALVSCFQYTAYFHYQSTDTNGWHRFDFLEYKVGAVSQEGYYVEEIGIRYNPQFPYRQLSLVIDQTVVHTATKRIGRHKSDTLQVELYDPQGRPTGEGVNMQQLVIPLKSLKLERGDSIAMQIRHNMKSTTIKGIAAIGMKLTYSMPTDE